LAWTIELSTRANRKLRKLDRQTARRITTFLRDRLAPMDNPRQLWKTLRAEFEEFWSYRVGDYRLPCELRDDVLVVLVVEIGHRSKV
jgi:mRNA interferase RelE/StbE